MSRCPGSPDVESGAPRWGGTHLYRFDFVGAVLVGTGPAAPGHISGGLELELPAEGERAGATRPRGGFPLGAYLLAELACALGS